MSARQIIGFLYLFSENRQTGPEGPELEGEQANREFKETNTTRNNLSAT